MTGRQRLALRTVTAKAMRRTIAARQSDRLWRRHIAAAQDEHIRRILADDFRADDIAFVDLPPRTPSLKEFWQSLWRGDHLRTPPTI